MVHIHTKMMYTLTQIVHVHAGCSGRLAVRPEGLLRHESETVNAEHRGGLPPLGMHQDVKVCVCVCMYARVCSF